MARRAGFAWGATALGLVVAVGLALLVFMRAGPADSADPGALWRIVHTLCVTDMKVSRNPAPCSAVDLAGRYAVLKDIRGDTQLLLIPTDRIDGIESQELLQPGAPNYFRDAWNTLPLFAARAGRLVPRQDLMLAINSVYGRSQDQLHIHVDCVRPHVRQLLDENQDKIGDQWSDFDVPLAGRRYRAMRLTGADLGDRNPFTLLAQDRDARADMGSETLAVIGTVFADGTPGFLLLSDRADWARLDKGTAEDLMDHSCAVLKAAGA